MLFESLSTARDLGRLQEIATVLVRHGLGDFVRRIGMAQLLERAGSALHLKGAEDLGRPPEVRLRQALEELGPTFVKVGQLLAGRTDLLPPAWTRELARLQERATEVPFEEIRAQLLEDLGAEPETLFEEFDPVPLAAASIAQVHRASLSDGTRVVLKIRRPGITETVEADLRLLARFAEGAEEHMPELRRFRPRSLARQFGRSLRNELDLRIEAKNAERLRRNLPAPADGEASLVIPRIHGQWTRERLCVMDYLEGKSIGRWIEDAQLDHRQGPRYAAEGAGAVLRMVFVDGCFHADPHPGNIIVLPDGTLGLVDFGMVGYLSTTRRMEFLRLLVSIVSRDVDETVEILLSWSEDSVDSDLLNQDCAAFIDRYHGVPLSAIDTSEMLADLTSMIRDHGLSLPSDVALLLKVFLTLDSLGRQLDPEFVTAAHIEPFAREAWRRQHSPLSVFRRRVRDIASLMDSLPRDLRQLSRRAGQGRLRIEVDLERLDAFGKKLDRSANRLTIGMIAAALIIGTSISLTVPGGVRVAGLPLFGFLGFTSSAAAGLWLLWSIMRSGRN